MEQRHQMLKEMQLSRKESRREIQDVVEHSYRRRSLSRRRSQSDHKYDTKADYTSNPDEGSTIPDPIAPDKRGQSADKNGVMSDSGESDVDHSKANDGYTTPTKNEVTIRSIKGDELVDKNSHSSKITEDSIDVGTVCGRSRVDGQESGLRGTPKEKNLRRMNTAVKLNQLVKDRSEGTQLLVINLPGPPSDENDWQHYMEFLDELTEGLDRVLMVRGGWREVITIYS